MHAGAAHEGQTAAPGPKSPAPRRLDIHDWPKGNGRGFELTWPGFKVEVDVKDGAAVLTADDWIEEIELTPDAKRFVCIGCERPTPILQEGPEHFLCAKCIAQHERT